MTILNRLPPVGMPVVRRDPRHSLEHGYDEGAGEQERMASGLCSSCGDPVPNPREEFCSYSCAAKGGRS